MVHVIKKGLDLPISGAAKQQLGPSLEVGSVGLVADDYIGMRPTMFVQPGDKVKTGQAIFTDKKNEGVNFVSPATGVVREVNRGAKRKFESVVIDLEGDEEFVEYPKFEDLQSIGREKTTEVMLESGLWAGLRTRPYSRSPIPGSVPHAIFVTAMDTNPLAPEAELVIKDRRDDFVNGLSVLTNLIRDLQPGGPALADEESGEAADESGDGVAAEDGSENGAVAAPAKQPKIHVCTRTDSRVPGGDIDLVEIHQFKGPHPAGLSGTHIHLLEPVHADKTVWTIGYQEVMALGYLFAHGKLNPQRVVSLAGPRVKEPVLLKIRQGACLDDVVRGRIEGENCRVISGSVLAGRKSEEPVNFLGRFHNQVTVIEEGTHREFLGWQKPGADKFTVTRLYLGSLLKKTFAFTSNINGGHRSMVPIETYERVMPLDILPTQLLRALLSNDTETAQALGCLELDEEDLALCTFVCPGKYDYGVALRQNLDQIEREG